MQNKGRARHLSGGVSPTRSEENTLQGSTSTHNVRDIEAGFDRDDATSSMTLNSSSLEGTSDADVVVRPNIVRGDSSSFFGGGAAAAEFPEEQQAAQAAAEESDSNFFRFFDLVWPDTARVFLNTGLVSVESFKSFLDRVWNSF